MLGLKKDHTKPYLIGNKFSQFEHLHGCSATAASCWVSKKTTRSLICYDEQLWLYYRVLGQKRDDKNKIYSFHAPEVKCISKGKEHKRYEFGNKSGFVITKTSGIILGAMAFEGNPYDGHTLGPQLEQVSDL